MHALERRDRSGLRSEGHERIRDTGGMAAGDDRFEPLGTLGMVSPGDVLQVRGVGREQHGHHVRLQTIALRSPR